MKQGVLIYDQETGRMDIQFGADDYYGGLHCGTTITEVLTEAHLYKLGSSPSF